ncbi:hypothetical protein Vretifemale_15752 [Volvox reticuliferus]|uniref:Uncharacterized protein n=1 Tax=Volvox reticuliferus TaxID=1737510 RepID=A0A8J4CSL6_9CHLO|nr:hypothetical protein Vretifemale_15752 [Volvox reticuliferus]
MYNFATLTYLRTISKPFKASLPHKSSSIVKTTATIGSEGLSNDPPQEPMADEGDVALPSNGLPQRTPEQTRAAQHVADTMRNATHNRVVALEGEFTRLKESFDDQMGAIRADSDRTRALLEQIFERLSERSQTSEAADSRKKAILDIIAMIAGSSVATLLPKDALQQTTLQAILEKHLVPVPTLEEVQSLWVEATAHLAGGSGSQTTAPKSSRPSEGWQSASKKPRTDQASDKPSSNRCRYCHGFKKPGQSWPDHAVDCSKAIKAEAEKKLALAARLESKMQE